LYIFGTVWLLQRGSPESKELGKEGRESDEAQMLGGRAKRNSPGWAKAAGLKRVVFPNSLLIVMTSIWVGSWVAQGIAGHAEYNADQLSHLQDPVSYLGYLGSADFWERTLQNWQSEFLAVGSMAILSVYLRQRGVARVEAGGRASRRHRHGGLARLRGLGLGLRQPRRQLRAEQRRHLAELRSAAGTRLRCGLPDRAVNGQVAAWAVQICHFSPSSKGGEG
jgi:hypothetical protein